MTRFLHSADWQLGMTRHFLGPEAQPRFSQARLDAVRTLARIARDTDCEFVVVAGDVFENNQLDRRTISRALEALREFTMPVFLLPGNHDPLDASSIFRSDAFVAGKPAHVRVLDSYGVVEVSPGVEVVGAPWTSKRPLTNLVAEVTAGLQPAPSVVRVMVGHGAVDVLSPDTENPARIALAEAERALASAKIHYLALGDRHSTTAVGTTGRIWYSGAPEPTDFREVAAGKALVVELTAGHCRVIQHEVGKWCFIDHSCDITGSDGIDALEQELESIPNRDRTILRLSLRGTLTLTEKARLEQTLDNARDVFACVDEWDRNSDIAVIPDDTDFADLDVSGFAQEAVVELRSRAMLGGPDAVIARDALALLLRFAGTRS